jgi:hypothetical protein
VHCGASSKKIEAYRIDANAGRVGNVNDEMIQLLMGAKLLFNMPMIRGHIVRADLRNVRILTPATFTERLPRAVASAIATSTGCGTVFVIDKTSQESIVHVFTGGADGGVPYSALLLGTDGTPYGSTTVGGSGNVQYGCCRGAAFNLVAQ